MVSIFGESKEDSASKRRKKCQLPGYPALEGYPLASKLDSHHSKPVHDWILGDQSVLVYLGIFLMLIGGAVGLPIPEDVPLILGGIAVQIGNSSPFIIFAVCYCSILAGDSFIYFLGRRFGPRIFGTKWFKKRVPPTRIRRIRLNLEKRSLLMIFIARHLFYMRTVTFLTCGAVKMRMTRFLFADALAALISVPLMMTIGYLAAEHYEEVTTNLRNGAIIIPPLLLLAYLIWRWSKKSSEEDEDSELFGPSLDKEAEMGANDNMSKKKSSNGGGESKPQM